MLRFGYSIILFFSFLATAGAQDSTAMKVFIADFDSIPEVDAKLTIHTEDNSFLATGFTDINGHHTLKVPMGVNLYFVVEKFDTSWTFEQTVPVGNFGNYIIPFCLQIKLTSTFIRSYKLPIHFESDSYKIDNQDKTEIKALLNELNTNANMKIEIGAHTDSQGSDSYNLTLSQQRANTVREYLISQGIDGNRILSKGYGETKPIGDNNTEEGRALNRRVIISVIEE